MILPVHINGKFYALDWIFYEAFNKAQPLLSNTQKYDMQHLR